MKVHGLLVVAVMSLAGCTRRQENVSRTWPVMGTYASITVPGEHATRISEFSAVTRETLDALNAELSTYIPDSNVSRLNAAAGGAAITVSNHTARMLEMSVHYGRLSEGTFDVTVGPLVRLWGFGGAEKRKTLPAPEEIRSALERTGFGRIAYDPEGRTASLPDAGMGVDFGGIAKGYAVDEAWAALTRMGVAHAMLDLGGNIRCLGKPEDADAWRIGVRNPFDRERIVGRIDLPPGLAVATSGHYEQFVEIDGERYSHIIDPRSGYPVQGVAGVTVVSETAVEADAMSTAFFVLGPKDAGNALARVPGTHVLVIPDAQPLEIRVSPGMKPLFLPRPEMAGRVVDL